MRAQLFQLLGQRDVIFQRVFGAAGVKNISGVTDGRFADAAAFERGIDGYAHVIDGIQRIEDAEDVDALCERFANEFLDDIVWIGRIADSVGSAQQHLEADIGDTFA